MLLTIKDFTGREVILKPSVGLYDVQDFMGKPMHGLAILLDEVNAQGEEAEPYAVLSVSFGEFIGIKNCAYIDKNNCSFADQLLDLGIADETVFSKSSGFCQYPLWLFKESFLKEIGGKEYQTYSDAFDAYMNPSLTQRSENDIEQAASNETHMDDIADGMIGLSADGEAPSEISISSASPQEQIDAFNEMYKPFSIIDYENGFYGASYSFNPEYELTQICNQAFAAYSVQIGEPPVNSFGLHSHGNGYEWEAVFREAFKDDPNLIQIQFNCEAGGLFYSSENLAVLMDFTKRFVEICRDYDRFAPLIAPGIANWERQRCEGEPTLGNLREFIEKYPNGKFTIATPEGIIYLEAEQCRQILNDPNTEIELRGGTFTGQWLLDHDITKYSRDTLDHDYYRVRTNGFETEYAMYMTM